MVSHKNHDHPEFLYWPRRRLIYWCLYHRQKLENSWIPAVMASHQCEGEQLHSSHVATFLCLMQMLWSWQFCFYPNFPASWCSPVAQTASLVRGACQQYNIILILNRKKKKKKPGSTASCESPNRWPGSSIMRHERKLMKTWRVSSAHSPQRHLASGHKWKPLRDS